MPRKIDTEQHEKQKVDIAKAVWRLAGRAGLESVSLREVATEAGVSLGRVQYYFPNKDAMLLFGLQLAQRRMESRVHERLRQLPEPVDAESILRAVLDEMLGDDPDSRQMIRVSIAYYGRALEDPYIAAVLMGDDAELRSYAADVVRDAKAELRTPPAVDPEKEAHIVWSLASSLGTEVAFGELSAEEAQTMMHYYLDRILGGFADTP
jgi:TetR/AcrR family transcriptional regulator, transcriptional repressor of bet genes